jgi:hypothetical protein
MARANIDYYVLDALANDIESVEDIMRLVNHPDVGWAAEGGQPMTRSDILAALPRLVRDKLTQVYVPSATTSEMEALPIGRLPSAPLESCYFGMTVQGRMVHANWAPPTGTQ